MELAKSSDVIGVRGSICASVFMVGAGAPGGVRLPVAKAVEGRWLKIASAAGLSQSAGESAVCFHGTSFLPFIARETNAARAVG